jgi:hypothetical protein
VLSHAMLRCVLLAMLRAKSRYAALRATSYATC